MTAPTVPTANPREDRLVAARLARAKATVTITAGDGEPVRHEHVSIMVRNNVATMRLGQEVLLERELVARVEVLGRRKWALHFDRSSDVWTIEDERRACCGNR